MKGLQESAPAICCGTGIKQSTCVLSWVILFTVSVVVGLTFAGIDTMAADIKEPFIVTSLGFLGVGFGGLFLTSCAVAGGVGTDAAGCHVSKTHFVILILVLCFAGMGLSGISDAVCEDGVAAIDTTNYALSIASFAPGILIFTGGLLLGGMDLLTDGTWRNCLLMLLICGLLVGMFLGQTAAAGLLFGPNPFGAIELSESARAALNMIHAGAQFFTRRRLPESSGESQFQPGISNAAISGLVATACLCAAFVLKRFYNRFTAKARRDSFGFLPDAERTSLNNAERMV